jgi:hypothetical protein
MTRRREPQTSRRERAAEKLRYWYQASPAGVQDDWSDATARAVIPAGAVERFRSEHPEVSAKGARRVEQALLQWVRIEGRNAGTHALPSRAVEALWRSLRGEESDWETFRSSLGMQLDAGLDALTHWVPDDDSEPMRATWSDAFEDEVPLTGYPTLFIVDGEVGIVDPAIDLPDPDPARSPGTFDIYEPAMTDSGPVRGPPARDAPLGAVSREGPTEQGSEERVRDLERLCLKHWLYLMLASLSDAPSSDAASGFIEAGNNRTTALLSALSCPRCRARNEFDPYEVIDQPAHPSRSRRSRWVVGGAVAVALGVALVATLAHHAAGIDYSALRVGDCVRTMTGPSGFTPDLVEVVDCTDPHTAEVYATFSLREGSYPGKHRVEATAERGCDKRFFAYVRNSVSETTLDTYFAYPTKETWSRDDDREVLCTIESPDPTTRSVRRSGR